MNFQSLPDEVSRLFCTLDVHNYFIQKPDLLFHLNSSPALEKVAKCESVKLFQFSQNGCTGSEAPAFARWRCCFREVAFIFPPKILP